MSLWKRLWAALPRLGITGLVIALIAGIVAAAYFAAVFPDWTGFGPPLLDAQGQELPHAKTLWDWLGLLLIPLVLAIGGFFLTRSENRYALQLQERREAEARKIEAQRAQAAALQAYLDQMTQLLLHENLRNSEPDGEVRSVARARTLAVFDVLEGGKIITVENQDEPSVVNMGRKTTVLQFLYETGLIGGFKKGTGDEPPDPLTAIVVLRAADLSRANLVTRNLRGADLGEAHLKEAFLVNADLYKANLGGANLSKAYLTGSNLHKANLSGANLYKAHLYKTRLHSACLREVYLKDANLTDADLTDADLTDADLTNCKVTREQLAQAASLEGAILPFDMAPSPAPEVEVAAQEDRAKKQVAAVEPIRK